MSSNKKSVPGAVNLEDLIPRETQIYLEVEGEKRYYTLRKITLADEAWMQTRFGSPEEIQRIFSEVDMPKIAQIVFHQLKSKDDFLPLEMDDYDDDGEKIKRRINGPERLMRCIVGKKHQLDILQSLLTIIGYSQPLLNEEEKASLQSDKKKQAKK